MGEDDRTRKRDWLCRTLWQHSCGRKKSIRLPEGYTWKSFMEFLLSTLPEHTRNRYLAKLKTSIRFWKEKGGVLSDEVIQKLKDRNIPIQIGDSSNYKTEKSRYGWTTWTTLI